MSVLKDKRAYLSGPIQFDNSKLNWRVEPKRVLVEEFGIDLKDPFDDPKQQWTYLIREAREKRDYDTMVRISKSFVRKDLQLVDRSDFLIAYVPNLVPTVGTSHEIINSNNSKKPTLLVTNMNDISYIPLWYFGFISTEFMFAGWNQLFSYLREVNEGKHRSNNRWSFIYGDI